MGAGTGMAGACMPGPLGAAKTGEAAALKRASKYGEYEVAGH